MQYLEQVKSVGLQEFYDFLAAEKRPYKIETLMLKYLFSKFEFIHFIVSETEGKPIFYCTSMGVHWFIQKVGLSNKDAQKTLLNPGPNFARIAKKLLKEQENLDAAAKACLNILAKNKIPIEIV